MEEVKPLEVIKNVTELTEKIKKQNEDADISTPIDQHEPSHSAECHCKECNTNDKEMEKIKKQQISIYKQNRYLKKAKYNDEMKKWDTAFVLQNKKTGLISEIRAASSYHACNMLGWKVNQAILLETINVKEREEKNKTKEICEFSTASTQIIEEVKNGSEIVVENNS